MPWQAKSPASQNSETKKAPPGGGDDDKAADSPIVLKCHYIHHTLLPQLDNPLYQHLEKMQILPTLYALYAS